MGCCVDAVGAVCIGGVVFRYPRFGSVPSVYRISAGERMFACGGVMSFGLVFWWKLVGHGVGLFYRS